MASDALRVPAALGLKVTLMLQVAFARTLLPQELVWAKSPLLALVMVMLVMFRVEPPVLVRTRTCGALVVPTFWLEKVKLAGEILTTGGGGAGLVPVPVRLTDCGLSAALSATFRAADRFPVAVGLKVTLSVHFAPAATLLPHVLLWEKSEPFVPVIVIPVIVSTAVPMLVSVTICTTLTIFTT
jgi:hypothetical protein